MLGVVGVDVPVDLVPVLGVAVVGVEVLVDFVAVLGLAVFAGVEVLADFAVPLAAVPPVAADAPLVPLAGFVPLAPPVPLVSAVVVPGSVLGVIMAGVNGPGAERTGITWVTVVSKAVPPGRVEGIERVKVTRTARGGPIGVTPSGLNCEPSHDDCHDVPSKYSKATLVASGTITSPASSLRSGSVELRTPSAVTQGRTCRHSPPFCLIQ